MINCKFCRNTKNCCYAGEDTEREECRDHIPTTNSDLLRAKTDEELAEWFLKIAICPCDAMDNGCVLNDDTCKQAWFNWLKAEVN